MPSKPEINLLLLPHLFHFFLPSLSLFPSFELTLFWIFFFSKLFLIIVSRVTALFITITIFTSFVFLCSSFSFFSTFGCLLRPYSIFIEKKKDDSLCWCDFIFFNIAGKKSLKGDAIERVRMKTTLYCVTRYFSSISNVFI